MMEDEVK